MHIYRSRELLTADGSLPGAVEVEMDVSVTSGTLVISSHVTSKSYVTVENRMEAEGGVVAQ